MILAQKRIPLATPTMHEEEMGFIQEAFEKNWIAPLGFNCDNFEKEMAAYLGENRHGLALSSGTAALHLAMKLAGVKPGDVVFCSDMTFAATVNPVSYEGGRQVFIDSEYETWNMDPKALEKAFEKYPECKVVVLVHLYGTPAKMDEILAICEKHGAILIEDAAESMGASYKGKQTGTFGDFGILSFNGNKIITGSSGGMLLTNSLEYANKARKWSTQSRENAPWYQHEEIGYNYRMSNICAGIGRGQMKVLPLRVEQKQAIFARYEKNLAGLPLKMQRENPDGVCNRWLSVCLIDEGCPVTPAMVLDALRAENIEGRPVWKPMHAQPVFAGTKYVTAGEISVSDDLFERGICLPSDSKMTMEDVDRICELIRKVF